MQGAAALLAPKLIDHGFRGGPPDIVNAPAGNYRTTDGRIALTVIKEEHFVRLAEIMGKPEWPADPRFATFADRDKHGNELIPLVAEAMEKKSSAEWLALFSQAGILAERINDFSDWLGDPHVQATAPAKRFEHPGLGTVYLTEIPGVRAIDGDRKNRLAPGIGEHGREILAAMGYDDGAIDGFVAAGALKLPAS